MSIISLSRVNFAYDDHQVLEDLNFTVDEGDYLGIIGPNGSGKTTLLKIILGLLEPVSGEVAIFKTQPKKLKNRWQIGYVPQRISQTDYQFPANVFETVKSGLVAQKGLLHFFNGLDEKIVDQAINQTKITKLRSRLISQLSGGERQRVFIARALVSQPKILILDEPTVGVDIASQEEFYTLLCDLNNKNKITIVLVSHDVDVIAREVKTVLFLNRKLIGYGKAKDLMKENYLEQLYGNQVKFITHHH